MSHLLFNPVRKILNSRKEKLREEMAAAGEAARKLQEEYEGKLRAAEKEAEGILSESRRKALADENQIIVQAKEEAARILERTRVEAEFEKREMSDDIKREIIVVASLVAARVAPASVDIGVLNQLMDETLEEMGDETWLN